MRDAARQEDEPARSHLPLPVTAADLDGALYQVERLVLAVVPMRRRRQTPRGRPFEEREGAVRLVAAGLDSHPGTTRPSRPPQTARSPWGRSSCPVAGLGGAGQGRCCEHAQRGASRTAERAPSGEQTLAPAAKPLGGEQATARVSGGHFRTATPVIRRYIRVPSGCGGPAARACSARPAWSPPAAGRCPARTSPAGAPGRPGVLPAPPPAAATLPRQSARSRDQCPLPRP